MLATEALPTATPCARLHVRHVLSDWGLTDTADTVELVVSELVTNAIQASMTHDRRPPRADDRNLSCVHVRLASNRLETLVEVWDGNPGLPWLKHSTADDEGGRGLMLVAALSKQWGWGRSLRGPGKVAWALIEIDR